MYANARNPRFIVQIEPYSLEANRVGEDIFRPVKMSAHRSERAAAKALMSLITGTDTRAKEYLAAVNNNPFPIALRYVARSTVAPFKAYSVRDLRAILEA